MFYGIQWFLICLALFLLSFLIDWLKLIDHDFGFYIFYVVQNVFMYERCGTTCLNAGGVVPHVKCYL